MSDDDAAPAEQPMYPVVIDQRPWEHLSRDELEATARETTDAILAFTPPERRETIRALLEHRYRDAGFREPAPGIGRIIMPDSATNPEPARLWGIFESIWRVMRIASLDEHA